MTDAEQFATEFLGVQPESFPVHINLKITGELLDAYLAHIEKKKADNIMNTYSETVTPFIHGRKQPFSLTNEAKVEYLTVEQVANKYPQMPQEQLDEIRRTTNVRILVWDWKNNCYEPENRK